MCVSEQGATPRYLSALPAAILMPMFWIYTSLSCALALRCCPTCYLLLVEVPRRCPEGAQSRVLIVSHLAYNYAYGRTGPIKRIARKIKEQQSLKSFHGSSFSMLDLLSRRCFSLFSFLANLISVKILKSRAEREW